MKFVRLPNDHDTYLSALEICAMISISPTTLWRITRAGTLPSVKVGRKVLYPRVHVEEWLKAQAVARSPVSAHQVEGRPS